jgi:tricorn protease
LQLLHFRVRRLPLAIDRGERVRLAAQLFFALTQRGQDGLQPPKIIDLGPAPSFFYAPHWSPDSKRIAFTDKHLRIWYVDAAGGKPVKIDTGVRGGFGPTMELSWSPDSQWIAYTRDLESQVHAVFVYSLATHVSTQMTDGMSNAAHPVFDPNGKYLYFAASTNNGPSDAGIDLSSLDRATNSSVYVVVLSRDGASPVPPQSDDENKKKADEDKKDEAKKDDGKKDDAKKKDEKPKPTVIDLAGIGNRILSLPIPAKNYVDMLVGKTGVLFLAAGSAVGRSSEDGGPPVFALWRFTAEKRETDEIVSGVSAYKVSFDGEKLFYARQDSWFLAPTADLKGGSPDAPQGKPVNNGGMSAMVDRRAAWKQMFDDYLRELNEAYHHFFFHYNVTPLLVVETSQFDSDASDEALDDLIKQIRAMGSGTRYYVPRTK